MRFSLSPGANAEEPARERDDGSQGVEDSGYRDTDDSEREQQEPDDRVGDQGEERQRPGEYGEDEPEDECHWRVRFS